MSVNKINQETLDFMQVLQTSDPQKMFSVLIRNILHDEYTDDFIKTQRICYLLNAFKSSIDIP